MMNWPRRLPPSRMWNCAKRSISPLLEGAPVRPTMRPTRYLTLLTAATGIQAS